MSIQWRKTDGRLTESHCGRFAIVRTSRGYEATDVRIKRPGRLVIDATAGILGTFDKLRDAKTAMEAK